MKRGVLLSIPAAFTALLGADTYSLDAVSVTATKFERESKEVPQSVTVVDSEEIEDRNVLNAKDAIETIPGVISMSQNNGYDSRLIIRGAGLKARYGIREIMVMRDGVPMTDPDSFTRLDFIDVDDMQSVEVFKGPGSIYAANASGGVVFIRSKSVFDSKDQRLKVGIGSFDTLNLNLKVNHDIDEKNVASVTISRRQSHNSWREWNEFDTTQASLKYGHIFDDDSVLQAEFAFTDANLKLPQSLSQDGFNAYKDSGKTANTDGAWQQSGRYSDTYFFNVQYEKEFENLTFRPQAYLTKWSHYHPVTGLINDAKDNYVIGTDLAFDAKHQLFGKDASLVYGVTARTDIRNNSKKYTYADYVALPTGRILKVTSDTEGDLAGVEDGSNTLYGAYVQESFSPAERLLVDIGMRYDYLTFKTNGTEYITFNYTTGNYDYNGTGDYNVKKSYNLFSPKIGATYALTETLNAYGLIAAAQQAPTDSEIRANLTYGASPQLDASTSVNYEVGLKQRSRAWSMDLALYYNDVSDEIVAVKGADNVSYYTNAGRTRRLGAELSLDYLFTETVHAGANGSLYNYTYVDYVDSGADYSGNKQRYIPDYQYSLFAGYEDSRFAAMVEGISYGPYYMDDANTEKYGGFTLVTNIMMAFTYGHNRLQFNVNNLFDKRYATEVDKVAGYPSARYYYTPASPRFSMLTYTYTF